MRVGEEAGEGREEVIFEEITDSFLQRHGRTRAKTSGRKGHMTHAAHNTKTGAHFAEVADNRLAPHGGQEARERREVLEGTSDVNSEHRHVIGVFDVAPHLHVALERGVCAACRLLVHHTVRTRNAGNLNRVAVVGTAPTPGRMKHKGYGNVGDKCRSPCKACRLGVRGRHKTSHI